MPAQDRPDRCGTRGAWVGINAPRISSATDATLRSGVVLKSPWSRGAVASCTSFHRKESLFVRGSKPLATAAQVVRQTSRDVWAGQAMEWAAALAFYGVLSVFPLLLAGAAAASYLISPSVVSARLSVFVESLFPAGVVDIDPIVSTAIAVRGQVGLSVIVLWLLGGRRILGALVTALDRVSDVDARHETVQRRALVELIVMAGIGLLFLVALLARPLLGFVWEGGWGTGASTPWRWTAGAAVHVLLLVAAFFALYTIVPRGERNSRAAVIGSLA